MQAKLMVWNILHDGVITGSTGTVPGDLEITVEIQYLRAMLPDPGDSFRLTIRGCRSCVYRRFDSDDLPLPGGLDSLLQDEAEILSAEEKGETVVVALAQRASLFMTLSMQFESITVATEAGRPVPLDELSDACRRYWESCRPAKDT